MKTLQVKSTDKIPVCITNDVGGTQFLPSGIYEVAVESTFHDYETGQQYSGRLVSEEDIQKAREAGISGYKPEDYRKYEALNPELYIETLEAAKNYDPAKVYFNGRQILGRPLDGNPPVLRLVQ